MFHTYQSVTDILDTTLYTGFYCKVCNQHCVIRQQIRTSTYRSRYVTHHNYFELGKDCSISKFLADTDKHWDIKTEDEFKNRIYQFFTTDEYKTILKQEIVKAL